MAKSLAYTLCIDWAMLAEQKQYLLELISADCKSPEGLTRFGGYGNVDHPLDGVVQILDTIQDQGEALGEHVHDMEED